MITQVLDFGANHSPSNRKVDRKVLADLTVHEPEAFNAIAGQAKAALV